MKTYSYWNNKNSAHDSLLFQCDANSILEADVLFEKATGINAMKNSWIGCEISLK